MRSDISVVIPLYNKRAHISRTLQSVLDQTLLPARIVVIDDGSTDDGFHLVMQMQAQMQVSTDLLVLCHQENQGVSAARNAGVRHTQSTYVAFLDADDFWFSNHIETLQNLIAIVPGLGLYSTMHQIQQDGVVFTPHSCFGRDHFGKVQDFFLSFSYGLSIVNASTACVNREMFLRSGGFPVGMHRGEDLVLWLSLAKQYGAGHSGTVTTIYNREAENRSIRLRMGDLPGVLPYLDKLLSDPSLSASDRVGANRLFDRIAFFSAAGMREVGDITAMRKIFALARQRRMLGLSLRLLVMRCVPASLLKAARRWRHAKAQ